MESNYRISRNIRWIESHLVHPETLQPLKLNPVQHEALMSLTRNSAISLPRKSGKTMLSAILSALYTFGPEANMYSHVHLVTMSPEMRNLLLRLIANMVSGPALSIHASSTDGRMKCHWTGSTIRVLAMKDCSSYCGINPSLTIWEEPSFISLEHKKSIDAFSAMRQIADAGPDASSISIGTEYAAKPNAFNELIKSADHVMRRGCPADVDWKTEEALTYHPLWDHGINQDYLREMQRAAINDPRREYEFRSLMLNQSSLSA